MRYDALFAAELNRRDREGLTRACVPILPDQPGQIRRSGQTLLNFSSNDYLGLAGHPALAAAAADYAARFGAGSTSSRLICGTLEVHAAIEARVAAWKGQEAAMLLASGWQANVSVIPALLRAAGEDAVIFSDALNHASLIAGVRLARARVVVFRHNDLDHLASLLAETKAGARFILTESVFSMDGDRADLARLSALAEAHDAFLYVDEAHATGVLGPGGAGLCAGIPAGLVMGTFSKGMGSFGAYVAGAAR